MMILCPNWHHFILLCMADLWTNRYHYKKIIGFLTSSLSAPLLMRHNWYDQNQASFLIFHLRHTVYWYQAALEEKKLCKASWKFMSVWTPNFSVASKSWLFIFSHRRWLRDHLYLFYKQPVISRPLNFRNSTNLGTTYVLRDRLPLNGMVYDPMFTVVFTLEYMICEPTNKDSRKAVSVI